MNAKELEAWLERLHGESYGWALSCTGGDGPRAADVLQAAYVRVISGRAVFEGRSSFRTWLFGVIRRVAQEEDRRARREERRMVTLDEALGIAAAEPAEAPDRVSAEALRRCLARLPDRQREILHLVFYQDMSIADAAEVMEISVGSARTHYERGKARLREYLGEAHGERPAAGS